MKTTTICGVAIASLLLGLPAFAGEPAPPVELEPPPSSDDWEFELAMYGFLAGLDATVSAGTQTVETSFDLGDILNHLDMTFMASASATNDRFRIAADVLYLGISGDASPQGPGYDRADLELKSLLGTVSATYRVWKQPGSWLELGAGVRYLGMDMDIGVVDFNGPLPPVYESASEDIWDGLGVVRFHQEFSPKWFFRFYADLGGGDSNLTWQLFASVAYMIKDDAALILGWRHMEYDFGSGPVDLNIAFSGPQIGMGFRF